MKPKVRVGAFVIKTRYGPAYSIPPCSPQNFHALGPHRKTKPVFGARNVQNAIIVAVANWRKFRPRNSMERGVTCLKIKASRFSVALPLGKQLGTAIKHIPTDAESKKFVSDPLKLILSILSFKTAANYSAKPRGKILIKSWQH